MTLTPDDRKLSEFFEEYRATGMAGVSNAIRFLRRKAVEHFLAFAGPDITLGEITIAQLDQFATYAEQHVRNWRQMRTVLLKVLEVADPAKFSPRAIERAKKAAMPAETYIEGSLREFFYNCFKPTRLRGRAANTIRLYRTTFMNFARFLGQEPMLTDLEDEAVAEFMHWMTSRGCSPCSANKERSNLLAIWNFAARRGVVKLWPTVEGMKKPKRTPQAWTHNELKRLMEACGRAGGFIGKVLACHWWTALHLVLWDTGERINAVLQLRWEHVDLDDRWLHVPAEIRKGVTGDMLFRLAPVTIKVLRWIQREDDGLVFAWPYSHTHLWYHYKKILLAAGLPTNRKSKFHRMRKSVASHAEAAGLDATSLLGHSSREITLSYLDPRVTTKQFASDVLFPIGADKNAVPGSASVHHLLEEYISSVLSTEVTDSVRFGKTRHWLTSTFSACKIETAEQLSADTILAYFKQLTTDGMAPSTLAQYHSAVARFVQWLMGKKVVNAARCSAGLEEVQRTVPRPQPPAVEGGDQ